jgi:hypothetical protein
MKIESVVIQEIKKVNLLVKNVLEKINSPHKFIFFAAQRHKLTSGFLSLLEKVYELAKQNGCEDLSVVLLNNIHDEVGWFDGVVKTELAHSTWRECYLGALGIEDQNFKPLAETDAYNKTMQNVINTGDLWKIVGALLFLEGNIPGEFALIKDKRNELFPETFVINENDDKVVVNKKQQAAKYLDDHIVHDARSHYPDLFKVLKEVNQVEEISEGIKIMAGAKFDFYNSQFENFLKVNSSL